MMIKMFACVLNNVLDQHAVTVCLQQITAIKLNLSGNVFGHS